MCVFVCVCLNETLRAATWATQIRFVLWYMSRLCGIIACAGGCDWHRGRQPRQAQVHSQAAPASPALRRRGAYQSAWRGTSTGPPTQGSTLIGLFAGRGGLARQKLSHARGVTLAVALGNHVDVGGAALMQSNARGARQDQMPCHMLQMRIANLRLAVLRPSVDVLHTSCSSKLTTRTTCTSEKDYGALQRRGQAPFGQPRWRSWRSRSETSKNLQRRCGSV